MGSFGGGFGRERRGKKMTDRKMMRNWGEKICGGGKFFWKNFGMEFFLEYGDSDGMFWNVLE